MRLLCFDATGDTALCTKCGNESSRYGNPMRWWLCLAAVAFVWPFQAPSRSWPGALSGGCFSQTYGVSGDGHFVVGRAQTPGDIFHAFLWDALSGAMCKQIPVSGYHCPDGIDSSRAEKRTRFNAEEMGRRIGECRTLCEPLAGMKQCPADGKREG